MLAIENPQHQDIDHIFSISRKHRIFWRFFLGGADRAGYRQRNRRKRGREFEVLIGNFPWQMPLGKIRSRDVPD
jgi:hypothetical protein